MDEHYYSENPNVAHDLKQIKYEVLNKTLLFNTDAGVFSKKEVDFGSDLLIRSLPSISNQILDMGCGYGPIGISTAVLNPKSNILMADINNRAVSLCQENIKLNKIKNASVIQSDSFTNIHSKYEIIVTNPPIRTGKSVIYSIFEKSIEYLQNGGALYVVIQKKQGAPSAIIKLTEIYSNCEIVNKEGGYWILKSTKA